jgi:hypothetical protein
VKWPIKIERKMPDTEAGKKLQQVIDILYPRPKLEEEKGIKFQVEYGADYNLEAALTDLEHDSNDEISRATIREVCERLHKVRKILEAYVELNEEAQYMIVDNLSSDKEVKAIEEDM